jgi:hypothetical protein
MCMEALAKEGPLDIRKLALQAIRAKGLFETDKVLAQTMARRVMQTFRMRARRSKVVCQTKTKGVCLWRLPTPGERPTLLEG